MIRLKMNPFKVGEEPIGGGYVSKNTKFDKTLALPKGSGNFVVKGGTDTVIFSAGGKVIQGEFTDTNHNGVFDTGDTMTKMTVDGKEVDPTTTEGKKILNRSNFNEQLNRMESCDNKLKFIENLTPEQKSESITISGNNSTDKTVYGMNINGTNMQFVVKTQDNGDKIIQSINIGAKNYSAGQKFTSISSLYSTATELFTSEKNDAEAKMNTLDAQYDELDKAK